MKKQLLALVGMAALTVTLLGDPASAYSSTSSGRSSGGVSSSSGRSSSPSYSTSSGGGTATKAPSSSSSSSSGSSSTKSTTAPKSVTPPPSNTGGSVSSSNKTSTASNTKPVSASKASTGSYFSSNTGASNVKTASGGRATSYDYRDPGTGRTTTFVYHSPSWYQTHSGFITGLGAGILVDRFFGPNYTNPASPLYNQGIPPGYQLSGQGQLIVVKQHHSLLHNVLAWFFGLLLVGLVIGGLVWAWIWYRNNRETPGSYGERF